VLVFDFPFLSVCISRCLSCLFSSSGSWSTGGTSRGSGGPEAGGCRDGGTACPVIAKCGHRTGLNNFSVHLISCVRCARTAAAGTAGASLPRDGLPARSSTSEPLRQRQVLASACVVLRNTCAARCADPLRQRQLLASACVVLRNTCAARCAGRALPHLQHPRRRSGCLSDPA
jgi:hypothetical protein